MKRNLITLTIALLALFTSKNLFADTLAQWTFETSLPAGSPGAGVWITNLSAEVGSGTASGLHSGASTYSNPAGNGSAESFSSTVWNPGDFYQFALSTVDYGSLTLSYDQTSSSTGPAHFYLSYSTDGVTFNVFGQTNTLLVNGSPNFTWNASVATNGYHFTYDLSSVTDLNNADLVYFRLVDADAVSLGGNGGVVSSAGSDRVDNFTVSAILIPEPTTVALATLGGLAFLARLSAFRRRS